jgi:hypothetical protein
MVTLASYTSDTSGAWEDFGRTATEQKIGQPFTVSQTGLITTVTVKLFQDHGSGIADNAKCDIFSDASGSPNTSLEQSSTSILGGGLGVGQVNRAIQTFNFAGTTTLNSGTTYWLVLTRSSTLGDPCYGCVLDNVSVPYSDQKQYNGTTWATVNTGYVVYFTLVGTLPVAFIARPTALPRQAVKRASYY